MDETSVASSEIDTVELLLTETCLYGLLPTNTVGKVNDSTVLKMPAVPPVTVHSLASRLIQTFHPLHSVLLHKVVPPKSPQKAVTWSILFFNQNIVGSTC